jgi:uncharacterized protein YndB with AHSA1/START domain
VDATPGAVGSVTFNHKPDEKTVVALTVVEADPPHRFSFRWDYEGEVATPANSLLVTFDLIPKGDGTLLRFTETGFDEAGKSDEVYNDHASGWTYFLPRITPYVDELVSRP